MRGQADAGLVRAQNEVVATAAGMFKGVIVVASQGRWETPTVDTREAAQTLLAALNAQMFPKPKADGLSEATSNAMADALLASFNKA